MTNIPPTSQQASADRHLRDLGLEAAPADPPQYAIGQENLGVAYAIAPTDSAQRPSNVYSGLSMDDIEAAQTLEVLRSAQSPSSSQSIASPNTRSREGSTSKQAEPLLCLITRQYPLAGAAINGSISAYSAGKTFAPFRYGAELFERTVGTPVVGTIGSVGRRTGVESGLRWALTRRENAGQNGNSTDMESGGIVGPRLLAEDHMRPITRTNTGETLPPYDLAGSSPLYQEKGSGNLPRPQALQPTLVQRVSGLGIAMRDESRRLLGACLQWLLWADGQLDKTLTDLQTTLKEWEEQKAQSNLSESEKDSQNKEQQSYVVAKIKAMNAAVVRTFAAAEEVVRQCANQALPANARELVLQYMNSLPYRHWAASSEARIEDGNDEAVSTARQAIVLAQQGLTVVRQVNGVVNTTLVEAEKWCQRLGRGRPEQGQSSGSQPQFSMDNTGRSEKHPIDVQQPAVDTDVMMEDADGK
ncbi:MAG: hypothetical protein Q9160_007127 [Pyrenula sp. 1 TL-2023]